MRSFRGKLILCILLVAVFTVIGFFIIVKAPYRKIVLENSKIYSVEPELIYAVMSSESGFNEKAVSGAGAVGLMQLMPSTAEWIIGSEVSLNDLYEPELNIKAGVMYLAYLEAQFNELWQVLAAYNAGETKVKEWLDAGIEKDDIPYLETENYIIKVERLIGVYKFRLFYLN